MSALVILYQLFLRVVEGVGSEELDMPSIMNVILGDVFISTENSTVSSGEEIVE